jgi:protocatechuate 3,4-dioxygenase beta subunit
MTAHKETPIHDHDLGFSHDLPHMMGRRKFMALMGGIGITAASQVPASALECIALPWETAGPFPADGTNVKNGQTVNALTQSGVLRQDLRSSFGDYEGTAEGVELTLELTLQDAATCSGLSGAAIYLWHCDAIGRYSLYDMTDVNFLRGVGVADTSGLVKFTTIVPGCYPGRWPHMHFEIFEDAEAAVTGRTSLLTAQLALPQTDMENVYATDARYSNGTQNLSRLSLQRDGVFRDNSEAQLAQQMLAMRGDPTTGYSGKATIPIDLTVRG